ncbi:Metallo-dependent phosphatase [Cystobasidium minutum MCA 4210]|uniref:Metallo-dependent phosphatase n=1 Tax=Cystobasidium minutum MCA 4210 TaxID=1397322 RepID=UPI0034CD3D36|eukprot:jgi/Rhomi1/166849/fgenesh1_kg.2_\
MSIRSPVASSSSTSIGTIHPLAIDHLPPKKPNTTRFVLLSDTHTHTFPVPDGDVLLHAGDLTERGSLKELRVTLDWICSLPHKYKIIIAGNHDYCLDSETLKEQMPERYSLYTDSMQLIQDYRESGLIYLEDQSVELPVSSSSSDSNGHGSDDTQSSRKTWKIFGSPWSAAFCSMAFNIPRGDPSRDLYSRIPDSTDILLTHGPPYGMLDTIVHGRRSVGCDKLLERLQTGLPNLKLHIWGHIHESRGVILDEQGKYGSKSLQSSSEGEQTDGSGKRKATIFVNAANAGTWERPKRLWGEGKFQPMVVDLNND